MVLDVVLDTNKVLKIAVGEDMNGAPDLSRAQDVDTDVKREVGVVGGMALNIGHGAVVSRTLGEDVALHVAWALGSRYSGTIEGRSSRSVL